MNIILTGFMGTGKTTVGKLLANQLGFHFVDTDDLVVLKAGCPIPQIFAERGEAAFRQMEREVAATLGQRDALVIATGGGLMLDPVNVSVLAKNGRIFCLTATPEEILARVRQDGNTRPLLAGAHPRRRIEAILREREAAYGQFSQIETSGRTPEEVVGVIMDMVVGGE